MAGYNIKDSKSKNLRMTETRFDNETLTMDGTLTLTVDSPTMQFLDPDGARDLVLPDEALSDGLFFLIYNAASGAEVITIKDDGSSTVCTPGEDESAIVFCDGTTWAGLVGASS